MIVTDTVQAAAFVDMLPFAAALAFVLLFAWFKR
jgi:hypothetical protein